MTYTQLTFIPLTPVLPGRHRDAFSVVSHTPITTGRGQLSVLRRRRQPQHHNINFISLHSPITATNSNSSTFNSNSNSSNSDLLLQRLEGELSALTRTGNDAGILPLIEELETPTTVDVENDARILGVWRNTYTTRPSTASIIQRTMVSLTALAPTIEQIIVGPEYPRYVVTRIDLRKSFMSILNVKATVTEVSQNRIHLNFDEAWFAFPNGMRMPYPVPFRLLGKKAQGWQDITFLNDEVRLTRGNKGSVFVLQRVPSQDCLPVTEDLKKACPEGAFD